jgi:hypothetical protein
MNRNALFALALVLAGCSTIPLSSIPKLYRINFMTTDIDRIRIALTVPPSFGLLPPPATFKYVYELEGEEEHSSSIPLEETREPADLVDIPGDWPVGSTLHVFRMPPSSAAQLAKLREDEKQRAKTEKKKGNFSIGIKGNFCEVSESPDGPILTTTYVLTSETETWTTFTRNLDVREQKGAEDIMAKLEPCP